MSEGACLSPVPTLVNESISKRCSTARRYVLLVMLCLGYFPPLFIAAAMFPSIPFLAVALHVSKSDLTWIVNASKLTFSSFLLIVSPHTLALDALSDFFCIQSGRMSDIFDPSTSPLKPFWVLFTLTTSLLQNLRSSADSLLQAYCRLVLDSSPTQCPLLSFEH